MMDFYNYGFGMGYGFGWFFNLVLWGLIIWAILALVSSATHGRRYWRRMDRWGGHNGRMYDREAGNKALEILKEKYVKGEITKEEYEEKKKVIS